MPGTAKIRNRKPIQLSYRRHRYYQAQLHPVLLEKKINKVTQRLVTNGGGAGGGNNRQYQQLKMCLNLKLQLHLMTGGFCG